MITWRVPVLKLPEKMHYSLFYEYKSVTKKSSILSENILAENIAIKVSALIIHG